MIFDSIPSTLHRPTMGSWYPKRLLAVALASFISLGCSSGEEPPGAYGKGVYVPATWQTTRDIEGHRVHVVTEKLACSSCHELTDTTIGPVSPQTCANCHEDESRITHAREQAHERFGEGVDADCTSCHIFAFRPTGSGPHAKIDAPFSAGDCLRCHASQQGNLPPVVVHRPADCLGCHEPHEQDTPVSASCDQCHENVTTSHAARGRDILQTCTTCHQSQHAPASAAIESCSACHQNEKPIVSNTALFEDGHSKCIGCHRPHDFEKNKSVSCQSCHESKHVLAEARVSAHRQCTSCHNPHDVKAASAVACSSCHGDIRPNHPKHGQAGTCTGCHDPHPSARTSVKARDCSTCHSVAASEKDFHQGVECRDCHAPHSFLLGSAGLNLCGKCHSTNVEQVKAHPGHQECQSCHGGLPHRPSRLNSPCSSCHATQKQEVHSGHANCQDCHDPHGSALVAQCSNCHSKEHRTAPRGHQQCTDCHDQHSGSHARATCSNCHAAQARTPHGQLGSDCKSCHRPHGPEGISRPPTCSSCHQSGKLSGLHQLSAHNRCSNCHTDHGEQIKPERPGCLSCHQDKVQHFPDARTCSSCHLFTRTK
jgi:hypothetical protein